MSLHVKMAAIMGSITKIAKDEQMNAGQINYKFVSDAAVYHKVRTLMVEHGLALFASMTDVEQERYVIGEDKWGKQRDKYHTRARFEFTIVDSESGDAQTCVWFGESEDSADKGLNKASTAALKYWLLKTFIIPTGDDPDASNGVSDDQEDDRGQYLRKSTPPKNGQKSDKKRERNSIADEPEPEKATWATEDKVGDMVNKARKELWTDDKGEPLNYAHARNRIVSALEMDGTAKNNAELSAMIFNQFGGTAWDAWRKIQEYVPSDKRQPATTA